MKYIVIKPPIVLLTVAAVLSFAVAIPFLFIFGIIMSAFIVFCGIACTLGLKTMGKTQISVGDEGIFGKADGKPFQIRYSEIAVVRIDTLNHDDSVKLRITTKDKSEYGLTLRNPERVRDIIVGNLQHLKLLPKDDELTPLKL